MRIQSPRPAGEIRRNNTGLSKRSLRWAPPTLTTLAAPAPKELTDEIAIQAETESRR